MGEVVELPPPDRVLWQCECDCFTFNLRADGQIRCAACGKVSDGQYRGRWRAALPAIFEIEPVSNDPVAAQGTNVVDFDSAEIAIASVLKKTKEKQGDLVAVISIFNDARCTSWCDTLGDRPQFEWLKRQLERFLDDMIVAHKIDMTAPGETATDGDKGPA